METGCTVTQCLTGQTDEGVNEVFKHCYFSQKGRTSRVEDDLLQASSV